LASWLPVLRQRRPMPLSLTRSFMMMLMLHQLRRGRQDNRATNNARCVQNGKPYYDRLHDTCWLATMPYRVRNSRGRFLRTPLAMARRSHRCGARAGGAQR
jgi:hypothetical protein